MFPLCIFAFWYIPVEIECPLDMEPADVEEGQDDYSVVCIGLCNNPDNPGGVANPANSLKGSDQPTALQSGDEIVIEPSNLEPPKVLLFFVQIEVIGIFEVTLDVEDDEGPVFSEPVRLQ